MIAGEGLSVRLAARVLGVSQGGFTRGVTGHLRFVRYAENALQRQVELPQATCLLGRDTWPDYPTGSERPPQTCGT